MTVILNFINASKNILTIVVMVCINSIAMAMVMEKPVAYINNQPVDAAELKREMLRHRSAIYNEYAAKFNLFKISDFWNANLGGKRPIDSLRYRALKALIEIKVQQQLLKKHSLWPYKNYGELLAALQQENEQRRQKVERKEIIYGPAIYTEQSFFDYKFSNALILLKKNLYENQIVMNDSTLEKHFDFLKQQGVYSDKKVLGAVRNQVIESFIEKEYKQIIAVMIKEVKIKIDSNFNGISI